MERDEALRRPRWCGWSKSRDLLYKNIRCQYYASFFVPDTAAKHSQITGDLKLASFNCKNVNTADLAIEELSSYADIILIQEHWLFNCKLHKLNEISEIFNGTGKAVDSSDPILPVQMPRGYGGVGILWKKQIDHLIRICHEGGNRIQCVELKGQRPMLLVSVYMPCRGINDNLEDFNDCLDQLNEIIQKYSSSHVIIIGGDWNEDIYMDSTSARKQNLESFLTEHDLVTIETQKTYINPKGALVSTLDYIFYPKTFAANVKDLQVLDNLRINVSDHLPVCCNIDTTIEKVRDINACTNGHVKAKVHWSKVDAEKYVEAVEKSISEIDIQSDIDEVCNLDKAVRQINNILEEAAVMAAPKRKVPKKRTKRLKVWTPDIQKAVEAKKSAFYAWKEAGRQNDSFHQTVFDKKLTTKALRQAIRFEYNNKQAQIRQEILEARTRDSKLFYKLINRQRGKLSNCVNELHVGGETFKTDSEILFGWQQHFSQLATPKDSPMYDSEYKKLVDLEFNEIIDICKSENTFTPVTCEETLRAIKSLNTGKSADIFNIQSEHFIHCAELITPILVHLFNSMFRTGCAPDCMKLGVLTPVFKRKGSNLDAKNYRGITITPTISKILEALIRERIKPVITENQNPLQRGFTEGSSPMNCSLILEEYIRNNKDSKMPTYIAFLDAKSAFDVVSHSSLLRKVYHLGIDGALWNITNSLHTNAKTLIKWDGQFSEEFDIHQGVKQGGVMSTDLYKVYGNTLLDRLDGIYKGATIGEIGCAAPACADDVAVASSEPDPLQSLVHTSADYGSMERFDFQLVKSVILKVDSNGDDDDYVWTLNGEPMPVVTESMHVGVLRSANTESSAVAENIKKARRTLYSLMPAGCHGNNGQDPETTIQLLQTYVLPILIYGMEVVLPKGKQLDALEKFYKKYLKLLLSVPVTAADPAVYILSGTVPIEATIHKRALILFGNISRLIMEAVEKRIAYRQLNIKGHRSNSWFIAIRELCVKYDLTNPLELLQDPPSKESWKRTVNKQVNSYWTTRIGRSVEMYTSLRHLHAGEFRYGRRHPVIRTIGNAREIPRITTKLKLVTGTYILQCNRSAFNQNEIEPTCLLCKTDIENTEHFLLCCPALHSARQSILDIINGLYSSLHDPQLANHPRDCFR